MSSRLPWRKPKPAPGPTEIRVPDPLGHSSEPAPQPSRLPWRKKKA